jgi:arginine decarboxylase
MDKWSIAKSADLYGIHAWGGGYFDINAAGHLAVCPDGVAGGRSLDLHDLVESLTKRGIELPVLIRFDGIIRDRVKKVYEAFRSAIVESSYKGSYRLAYPVKVNQQRHVVDTVYEAGREYGIGLEVGSKPEMLAVLALHNTPGGLLLCNGYKDAMYIELALLARKLGIRSIIIVEQLYEVGTILTVAEKLGVEAEIGIRIKPAAKGSGKWEASAGDAAKFGLNSYEVIEALEKLRKHERLHWLKLLHFHIGSQITSIGSLKNVLREAARMYVELAKLSPSIQFFDVGGGLGVDYDGSRSNFESSMNYTLEEYARDIIWETLAICEEQGIPHPDIVSESGRATVAHHAVLVTEVMDVAPVLDPLPRIEEPPTQHETLAELYNLYANLTIKNCHETFNDAVSLKDEILNRFNQGDLSLAERGYADRVLKHLFAKINGLSKDLKYVPEDLEKLDAGIRDTYFCNFSLFQSLPDSWAIDQLFPLMPIHKLETEPARRAVIADLTCDSDGIIDRFIDLKSINRYVRLHAPNGSPSPYYIGFFLVGAYQEILGDLHNLFGDTNAVHIDFNAQGELEIRSVVEGDTVREVLHYVQFEPQDLLDRLRASIERSLRAGTLTEAESFKLQRRFKEGLDGYTYLLTPEN